MDLNRRDLGKLALAAAVTPARALLAAKPNSKFDGVQIGAITYCYRDKPELANNAEELLKLLIDSNISAIELMPPAAESFAGAPLPPRVPAEGLEDPAALRAAAGELLLSRPTVDARQAARVRPAARAAVVDAERPHRNSLLPRPN